MPPLSSGTESFAPGGRSGDAFVEEARRFLQSFTHRAGLSLDVPFAVLTPSDAAPSPPDSTASSEDSHSAPGGPAPIITPSSPRPSMLAILPLLPSAREMRTAFDFYSQVRSATRREVARQGMPELRSPFMPAVRPLVLRAGQSFVHRISLAGAQSYAGATRPRGTCGGDRPAFPRHDPWHLRVRSCQHDEQAGKSSGIHWLPHRYCGAVDTGCLAVITRRQGEPKSAPGQTDIVLFPTLFIVQFVEEPKLDGVRAAAVIASFYVVSPSPSRSTTSATHRSVRLCSS